jgi:hypothetical protein
MLLQRAGARIAASRRCALFDSADTEGSHAEAPGQRGGRRRGGRDARRRSGLAVRGPTVITVELARALLHAGLFWSPAQGDRFVLPGRGMDDEVFWLSDMTVEVHELPRGRVVGFNGTTEWALDSVHIEEALWLPREDQLRARLGDRLRALQRDAGGFVVVLSDRDGAERHRDADAECAYARALLAVLCR